MVAAPNASSALSLPEELARQLRTTAGADATQLTVALESQPVVAWLASPHPLPGHRYAFVTEHPPGCACVDPASCAVHYTAPSDGSCPYAHADDPDVDAG